MLLSFSYVQKVSELAHLKCHSVFAGSAKEAGTGTDDIAAGSPQHALQQQETHCV